VDTPRGDLNHNGLVEVGNAAGTEGYSKVQWSNVQEYELFPTATGIYAAAANEAHFYSECSGRGACNRDTGECACFPGFTGSACQRSEWWWWWTSGPGLPVPMTAARLSHHRQHHRSIPDRPYRPHSSHRRLCTELMHAPDHGDTGGTTPAAG